MAKKIENSVLVEEMQLDRGIFNQKYE